MPHSAKMTAGELSNLAHSWCEQPIGIIGEADKGTLDVQKTYLSIGKEIVPVSVEKDIEENGDLKVLLYEADGKTAKPVIKSSLPKMKTDMQSLDGKNIKNLSAHKIGLARVKFGK